MDEQFEKSFKEAPSFVRWSVGLIVLIAVIVAAGVALDYAVPILQETFLEISQF